MDGCILPQRTAKHELDDELGRQWPLVTDSISVPDSYTVAAD
ncbi:hypothetical protein [Halococcus sediminicola]|nr:hypothetical protein [Halococcus sediminicola]